MPRKARLVVPHTPHHVIQRGHNRQTVFVSDQDYRYYLENLFEWKEKLHCKLYGWCLMTNHIHLLIDPGETPAHLGLLMKRVAGRQTRYVNALEQRSGSLWEGRYKSSPVETDTYLLACSRYIELNPVRARMVALPKDYPWSSYRAKTGHTNEPGLDSDPAYQALSNDPESRSARYQAWVEQGVPRHQLNAFRRAIQLGDLTGSERFRKEIEDKLNIRLHQQQRGRPKKRSPDRTLEESI